MALSRRELLVLGGGVVCARAMGCGGNAPVVLDADIAAGNAASIATNSLQVVVGKSVAIGRDGGGIYALSLVCTHEGCDIPTSAGGAVVSFQRIHCGCHGSDFNGVGNVLGGPATRPLPHLEVVADTAGALTIHGNVEVPAATRLTV
jgi:Rieske Fe-S protein